MIAQQSMKVHSRNVTVLQGNNWGYNFMVFALLLDIIVRSVVFHDQAWDLFVLMGISGVITMVYAARQKSPLLNRDVVIFMGLGATIAAVVSAILAMSRAM